ncbi:MAG TPA: alpha/beta hydrolase domain-containing protein [candidate division Zixibacteria bacterium]|nr:alpha/beta hydrolase domain-containing protein [candidate division Zixibacteria bacterium]
MFRSAVLIVFAITCAFSRPGFSQEKSPPAAKWKDAVSCDEFAPPKRQALGQSVGIERCLIVSEEVIFNVKREKFRRVEIRLTGTTDGWASKEKGPRSIYFTDGPDFVFTQSGLIGARARGIARYDASTGHGMTILYPEDRRHWNGKLYVTAHGAGSYGAIGNLVPREPGARYNRLQNVNRYVTLMIDKGYAVAHTMRSSDRTRGDAVVTLEDGSTLKNNLSSHAGLITSWTQLVHNFISRKLGSRPKRTYFYGHSAGGFLGRLVNYQAGANRDQQGNPVFDGFLLDDAGSGLWLPKLVIDGIDTLFTTDEDRRRFAKQIDITHALYAGETGDYLHNKRENARILRDKGLADRHRMYEIRGVSHFDAGQVSRLDLVHQTLDLTGLFDALIDGLDNWVEKGVPPAATKSDDPDLSGVGRDGKLRNPAVALPEVACPLGVYHLFPHGVNPGRRGGQETAFAPYDGVNLEPLDARGQLVDMNGNGIRDRRETVTQAWQRLGLLKPGQSFNRAAYVKCVKSAADTLARQGLLPRRVAEDYVKRATKTLLN